MKLLESEVGGSQLRELEDVGVLCPELDHDGPGFVKAQDKESEDMP